MDAGYDISLTNELILICDRFTKVPFLSGIYSSSLWLLKFQLRNVSTNEVSSHSYAIGNADNEEGVNVLTDSSEQVGALGTNEQPETRNSAQANSNNEDAHDGMNKETSTEEKYENSNNNLKEVNLQM